MKKFVCSVCGYVFEGEAAPEFCPQCKAPKEKFNEAPTEDMAWAAEHQVGIAKGLDEMVTSPDKGRAAITESLGELKKVYDAAPMSVALSIFRDSKLDELVNVYSKAPESERTAVYDLLQPIYPTESQRLNKIKNPEETR